MSTKSKKKAGLYTPPASYQGQRPGRQSAVDFMRSLHDVGNGIRIVQRYGQVLRFCSDAQEWMVFDGKRFSLDRNGQASRLAIQTAAALLSETTKYQLTSDETRKVERWVTLSHSDRGIRAALAMASTQKTGDGMCMRISGSDLNRDPMSLNLLNGTYDLDNERLKPHDPSDAISYLAPTRWNPRATSPRWQQFLAETFCGDPDLIRQVQRLVGYSITGQSSEQVLILLNGGGGNGKGVFSNVISEILGDYSRALSVRSLTTAASNDIRADLASLPGSRFITASEGNVNDRFDEALVKLLTGEDQIRARFLYQNDFTFRMTGKVWLQTNHLPTIAGSDHAIWRRILVVPFDGTVREVNDDGPGAIRDPKLKEKLLRESSGILNWMIEGCALWKEHGIGTCRAIEDASSRYRAREDSVTRFVKTRCRTNENCSTISGELFRAYEDWCKKEGRRGCNQTAFGSALRSDFPQARDEKGQRVRRGIELLNMD